MSTIALAGNPNSGKSVLFNRFTGLQQKVANYPGVTVEKVSGASRFSAGKFTFLDLPGIYSLNESSEDAKIATEILQGKKENINTVIIVLDSTNLKRSLALAMQIKDQGKSAIVALNMLDELMARGGKIDEELLQKKLGVPVFSISATRGWGLGKLIKYIEEDNSHSPSAAVNEKSLEEYQKEASKIAAIVYSAKLKSSKFSERIDAVVLHRFLGPLTFIVLFLFIFQSIFSWATFFMDGIEAGFNLLSGWVEVFVPDSLFQDFLIEGGIKGVGSVLTFIPQIIILFLFIGLMEYTGYMARASFVMDRFMEKIGLQGKSFLPLLTAFACAIPGIMATRAVASKKDRLITIFIAPFMTCSARLPVYTLLITGFIPNINYLGGLIGLRTLSLIGLYLAGVLGAIFTALIMKVSMQNTKSVAFIQEIPPYRMPSAKVLCMFIWTRVLIFLKKAGKIIFTVTVILWILASFPRQAVSTEGVGASYAGMIGKTIEPAIRPLGFDWKIGLGLVTSLAAREVIISTLATIYGIENKDQRALEEILRQDLSLPSALSLLVFFVFALQCLATVAVVRRETGSWKWPILQFLYMFTLAYTSSLILYQTMNFFY